jgi:hypothetical protein
MACFFATMAEAAVTTVVIKHIEKKEKKSGEQEASHTRIPWSRKLKWLNNLLWGGSALLAFEHIWHGEITAQFPFITALNNPAEVLPMLKEVATVGVGMAALVTLAWVFMIKIADARAAKKIVITNDKAVETESCI